MTTLAAGRVEKALALGVLLGLSPVKSSFFGARSREPGAYDPRQFWARRYLSWRYLRGSGIEIGALHQPLPLYWGARAKYVDRCSMAELRAHYPELKSVAVQEPDIIDNGEGLETITTSSLDFIIANHFIEHCQNPIATLENHLSKLKPGGNLFLAVPLRENTFDSKRELTSIEHLVRDYRESPEHSRTGHYREWAELVHNVPPEQIDAEAARLMAANYSIHFHVWSFKSFQKLISHLGEKMNFPIKLKMSLWWKYNPGEGLFIIEKR